MHRRQFLQTTAIAQLAPAPAAEAAQAASLDATLRTYLARYALPALAAAVVRQGAVIAAGAVGTRRAGTDRPVTLQDRFHIGSDTKAMTALLAAMYVEQGKLRWDSTVGEQFPDLVATMDAGLRDVTLQQLLSHTSGMPSDNDVFGKLLLQSYAEVGAMLERLGKRTWEEMVVERIFTPLGLETAGFGPQSSMGRVDAPLGHAVLKDATLKPMLAGPNGDNPLILGPAGTVHLSILDFAAWAGWNAGEGRRGPALVGAETLRKLHTRVIDVVAPDAPPGTPAQGGYCLGWGILKLPYAREPFVMHTGSNTLNLAMIMLQPSQDFAMVLATNVSGSKAGVASKAVAEDLYKRFGPER